MNVPTQADVTARSTVEVLRRVPMKYRVFFVPERRALGLHRIPRQLLDELLDHGLPHAGEHGERRYHLKDLRNISLRHRLPAPEVAGVRYLAKSLQSTPTAQVVHRTVTARATCPEPGHPGECDFEMAPTLARSDAVRRSTALSPSHYRFDLALHAPPPEHLPFSPAMLAQVEALSDVEYHHLPDALTSDIDFLRETRIADCRLASHFLVSQVRAAGERIRPAYGLMVARPYSGQHCWVEVPRRNERWVPADPFFLTALVRWGLLDGAAWPANRVPHGTYWKLGESSTAIITHQGVYVRSTLATR